MEQKITITIADRQYPMKANSADQEEAIRKAAVRVNTKIAGYQDMFPGKSLIEILSLVALSEGVENVGVRKRLEEVEKESKQLQNEIENYLENIDK